MALYSIHRYPRIVASSATPIFLSLFVAGLLWYGFAAVRWTRLATPEDFIVLRYGIRWGIAIGLLWIVEVVGGNIVMPHYFGSGLGVLAAFVAAILPVVAGFSGAAITGRIRTGTRIGFWTGVVSGLITFGALAIVGYVVVNFPGFPGLEIPKVGRATTVGDLAAFNIGDYLAGGVSHLVLIGAPFCGAAGTLGGIFGWAVNEESSEKSRNDSISQMPNK